MKKLGILFALLIGISGVVASDPAEYSDPLTGYSVARLSGASYQIQSDKHKLASSFTLEEIDGKVFLKDFVPQREAHQVNSMLAILGYLEAQGLAISGEESSFFWSDTKAHKAFLTQYGFELLSEVPVSLKDYVPAGQRIYLRAKKISLDVEDEDGQQGTIER